jgi:hypothetical protein
MAEPIDSLMHANLLEVFDERDDAAREAAIARTYAPNVRWTDDEGVTVGHAGLNAKAVELQDKLGPLRFVADGSVQSTTGFGYLAWHAVPPGATEPAASGFDVAIIRDGLIAELYTVLKR